MKKKKGFNLRNICGENIIVAEGKENIDFSKIISMNQTATFLWNSIDIDNEFDIEQLVDAITSEYDIDRDTAMSDVNAIIKQWTEIGIIE